MIIEIKENNNIESLLKYDSNEELKRILGMAIYSRNLRQQINPLEFFRPFSHQQEFRLSNKKLKWVIGGNRSGKTLNGAEHIISNMVNRPGIDCWACTFADMSVPIQQKKIYELLPKTDVVEYASFSEQRGFVNKIIILKNKSILRFKTYDQGWESFQGAGKDLIWNDEEPPEEIYREQKARLIDKCGTMLTTMTPLNGISYTYDEVIRNINKNDEVAYWFWSTYDNLTLDKKMVNMIMGSYAEKEMEVRTSGKFVNLKSGVMYYAFTDELNLVKKSPFGKEVFDNLPIEVSCDFNVNFMNWSLGQCINDTDYEFDSVYMENRASTAELCDEILKRYGKHNGGFIFYTDIAGKKGSTVVSYSDINVIQSKFPQAKIYYQGIKNVGDRVSSVNARLKNANGEVRVKINESKCPHLITDLRRLTWEIFLSESLRKTNPKLTHPTDGLSYKLYWKYPLNQLPSGKYYR